MLAPAAEKVPAYAWLVFALTSACSPTTWRGRC